MHRARFPEEACAELLEGSIGLDQCKPERMRLARIVRTMHAIRRERDRVRDLVRHFLDRDRDAELGENRHHASVEIGDRSRLEREPMLLTAARAHDELMCNEVELDVEGRTAVRYRRRTEAARSDIERHVPTVVEPGG